VPTEELPRKNSRIEGIVTLAFMLAVLTSLAVLALRNARQTAALDVARRTHALVERELSLIATTPFAALPARAGCETSRGDLPHTRCVMVADLSPRVRRVTLVIQPMERHVRADTVVIDRAAAPARPLEKP
jgi:hypothetical protein